MNTEGRKGRRGLDVWGVVCVFILLFSTDAFSASKLNGTLSLRCKGNGQPFSFVKLALKSGEEVSFEFLSIAAIIDKAVDFTAQKCSNGTCVSGQGHAKFDSYKSTTKASGTLKIEFADGDRIDTVFRAIARPKITGHCE